MTITFSVPGLPQPAGSKRAFPFRRKDGRLGVQVTDANPKSKDWKYAVASAGMAVKSAGGVLLECPLSIKMVFELPRFKSHYGKKGLKPSAPKWPTGRPDVLKLGRAAEDALTGVLWRDDAQIVMELLVKKWGERAMLTVQIDTM